MKKIFKRVLAVFLIIAIFLSIGSMTAIADSTIYTDGVWQYTVSNGCATLVGLTEPQYGEVCGPPSKLGGYPLKVISGVNAGAVVGICTTQFIIPQGVETITQQAFNTAGFTSIVIPLSLKNVCFNAFPNCFSFNTVYYEGSPSDWNNIYIDYPGLSNEWSIKAQKYYYYKYKTVDEPEIVFPDGYNFNQDKYPFTNPTSNEISYDKFTFFYGQLWGSIMYAMLKNSSQKGECFGMATTTGAFLRGSFKTGDIISYDEQGNTYTPKSISEVWNNSNNHKSSYIKSLRMPVTDFINYGYIYQWGPYESWIESSVNIFKNLSDLYNNVYDYVYNGGEPVVINMMKGFKGHSVLAVGLEDGVTEKGIAYTKIIVDDSNYLEENSIILLKNDDGEYCDWIFEFQQGDDYRGTSGSTIQFCKPCEMFSKAITRMSNGTGYNIKEDVRLLIIDKEVTVDNFDELILNRKIWQPLSAFNASLNSENQANETKKQIYWMDSKYTNAITFSTAENGKQIEYANYDSSVMINIPPNSSCDVNINDNNQITFAMSDSQNKEIEITRKMIDENGELIYVTVTGTAYQDVKGSESEDGIEVEGLNNITVTLETAYGTDETTAKVADGEKITITVDAENNTVSTDWHCKHLDENHDGICDNCGENFAKTCKHFCHSNNKFVQFIFKICCFLWRFFCINKYCSCGKVHY